MFAAILARNGACPPQHLVQSHELIDALAPFTKPDRAGERGDGSALIIQAIHFNTLPSMGEATPEVCKETGRIIASWVRLDNRTQLCEHLNLRDCDQLSDPQIILAAHRRWGTDCAAKLRGDFSFMIVNPERREAYCARDPAGVKPFYYMAGRSHFIAASSLAAIKAACGGDLTPDPKWMALFASGFTFADSETAYSEIAKLRPGHHFTVTEGVGEEPTPFATLDLSAPHSTARDIRWVERYSEAFNHAVDVRAMSQFPIGAENSGGLDSASIIAQAVKTLPDASTHLHTFAQINHEREEMLLDELAAMIGLQNDHREIRPEMLGIDDAVARAITVIGHPPEHGQPLLHAAFYEAAQGAGVRTILSGFGGDEIVTGYAKHLKDEFHEKREWRALFGEIEGSPPRRVMRFMRRLAEGPNDPGQIFDDQLAAKLEASCLSREFLEDSGLKKRIEKWMRPQISETTLNEIAVKAPGFRYGRSARLEASAIFASSYGMEYRFPLFDWHLIQFFLHVPSIEKARGSLGRYLHRRAVSGTIPDRIAWQPNKDMGPPMEGQFRFASYPPLGFGDLPGPLQNILDKGAFNAAQARIINPASPLDHTVMRARYLLWHIRQIACWLHSG